MSRGLCCRSRDEDMTKEKKEDSGATISGSSVKTIKAQNTVENPTAYFTNFLLILLLLWPDVVNQWDMRDSKVSHQGKLIYLKSVLFEQAIFFLLP